MQRFGLLLCAGALLSLLKANAADQVECDSLYFHKDDNIRSYEVTNRDGAKFKIEKKVFNREHYLDLLPEEDTGNVQIRPELGGIDVSKFWKVKLDDISSRIGSGQGWILVSQEGGRCMFERQQRRMNVKCQSLRLIAPELKDENNEVIIRTPVNIALPPYQNVDLHLYPEIGHEDLIDPKWGRWRLLDVSKEVSEEGEQLGDQCMFLRDPLRCDKVVVHQELPSGTNVTVSFTFAPPIYQSFEQQLLEKRPENPNRDIPWHTIVNSKVSYDMGWMGINLKIKDAKAKMGSQEVALGHWFDSVSNLIGHSLWDLKSTYLAEQNLKICTFGTKTEGELRQEETQLIRKTLFGQLEPRHAAAHAEVKPHHTL